MVKNSPASAGYIGDASLIPGSGRCSGGRSGNPVQHSCLGNPMDREAWQCSPWGHKESDLTEQLIAGAHSVHSVTCVSRVMCYVGIKKRLI